MKKINIMFIFILCLSLFLLSWTVYKSASIPTQHENLFFQDSTNLEQNYNKIKQDEAIFNKYYKIEHKVVDTSLDTSIVFKITKLDVDTTIHISNISNIKALLTKAHTNKFNKILEVSFNQNTNEYILKSAKLDKSKWRVELKMDIILSKNDNANIKNMPNSANTNIVLYQQININANAKNSNNTNTNNRAITQ